MSNSMSFGRPYILRISGCIHDGWLRLSDFDKRVDVRFLAELLASSFVYQQYESLAAGSGVQNLNKEVVRKVAIPLPSLPEQQAIADVLSGFDEHLANLDALIAKKQAIRDGALEELVSGTRRIPGFSQPWRVINFAEEIIPKARIGWQGLKAGEYLRSGYSLLISGTDFEDGHVSTKQIFFVSQKRYEMDPAIQVQAGDVLVTKDGTIGKVALVPDLGMPATLNSGVFVFRPHSSLAREFLYWVLMSSVFRAFINTLAAGSTIKHLYQKDLADFSFSAPSTDSEQISISEALFAMDAEIVSLVEERAKVERLKQGAMEDLLTGRVRLPVHEEAS
ncbi:hypothetical protein AN946_09850 [Trueperella pyogenes]|nr:hypothetical protein AN946_09850 [Trueperella pyogenes]